MLSGGRWGPSLDTQDAANQTSSGNIVDAPSSDLEQKPSTAGYSSQKSGSVNPLQVTSFSIHPLPLLRFWSAHTCKNRIPDQGIRPCRIRVTSTRSKQRVATSSFQGPYGDGGRTNTSHHWIKTAYRLCGALRVRGGAYTSELRR